MLRNDYLIQPDIQAVTSWLAGVLNGEFINYRHNVNGDCDRTLRDAFNRYYWPYAATSIEIPGALPIRLLPGTFAENAIVLNQMQAGLLDAFRHRSNQDLYEWMRAILQWGGVYRYGPGGIGGNRGWLEQNVNSLIDLLNAVTNQIDAEDDNFVGIANLRFNAGTTKVYSLLRPDFIIYDSRVAAGLAWLILNSLGGQAVPECLRFRCLPARGNHVRNPHPATFLGVNGLDHIHAQWNVRANWILSEALAISRHVNKDSYWSLREIEAALFVMGYDVQYA